MFTYLCVQLFAFRTNADASDSDGGTKNASTISATLPGDDCVQQQRQRPAASRRSSAQERTINNFTLITLLMMRARALRCGDAALDASMLLLLSAIYNARIACGLLELSWIEFASVLMLVCV